MKKMLGSAKVLLAVLGSAIFTRASLKIVHLLKDTNYSSFEEMGKFLSQSLNFFIIAPTDNDELARQQMEMMFLKDKGLGHRAYDLLHEDKFEPAELVAAVAYLFYQISSLHFTQHDFIEDSEFQSEMQTLIMNSKEEIMDIFPNAAAQFNLFLKYFEKNYLSPWNPARYSDHQTKENFGTGVDYFMK